MDLQTEQILEMLHYVLGTEIGKDASNFDWQEYFELSDEQYEQLQNSMDRLRLEPAKEAK